ncbi:NAD(P)-dependent oxidoreductase [Streptococcus dentapri]|uniref:NAD(P)-dependent oxidoreductase n=1 Tax=Streptococcus dentapri TaxID=573564 RepID=A0ABV8D1I7_9STRE
MAFSPWAFTTDYTGAEEKAITKQAVEANFETTAIVRNLEKAKDLFGQTVSYFHKDAFDLQKEDLTNFDVIVNTFSPSGLDIAYQHIDLAAKLIAFFRQTENPRLFFILGAGSLKNGKGGRVLDDLEQIPDVQSWIEAPRQQAKEFTFLSTVDNVNWVGISPGFLLSQGPAKS